MRCPLAALFPLVVAALLCAPYSSSDDGLLGPSLRRRLGSGGNRFRWRPERVGPDGGGWDDEEERVGEALVAAVMGGWMRVISGVKSVVDGVADDLRSRVEEGKMTVEGVAKGIQATVDGAVHDAGEVLNSVLTGVNPAIFPGTNWCGSGDRARSYNDTGIFETADRCCRAHDSCPDAIGAGKTRHGLKNEAPYTQSLCDCDQDFYNCLKNSNSLIAKNIGVMFFNILKIKCFTYGYPLTCKKRLMENTCERYDVQSRGSKIWQLLDNPSF